MTYNLEQWEYELWELAQILSTNLSRCMSIVLNHIPISRANISLNRSWSLERALYPRMKILTCFYVGIYSSDVAPMHRKELSTVTNSLRAAIRHACWIPIAFVCFWTNHMHSGLEILGRPFSDKPVEEKHTFATFVRNADEATWMDFWEDVDPSSGMVPRSGYAGDPVPT